jgi:hypothetical protein
VRDEVDVLRVRPAKGREVRDDAVALEYAGRDLPVMTALSKKLDRARTNTL